MKNSRFILTVAILLAGAGINYNFSRPDISLPRKDLSGFPRVLGDWTAVEDQRIDDQSMKILKVDDYMMRTYRNSNGDRIGLYIGYFTSQREGKGIHSPRQCLPGAGWNPVETSTCQVAVEGLQTSSNSTFIIQHSKLNQPPISANKFLMGKGLDRDLYLFWYQGRGRAYASEYWNKIYLVWDGLTKKRTDGALIRINSSVRGNPEDTLRTETEFIQSFVPFLKEYIPE